ncbi:bifunctional demethylmenaquinone methyltransferase/2-methoxy-6-polyprenyl-1,4-benzoquinol methylase UbiE [Bauldia sp.]|uniref:bifunctional demethylmenaquinone methyltransferase/2-methoxy-6-polyprenyl-1,4-benzoquinol methylase UbiE n=1 Tax=Bauldia sp. TaxID=2575872 RepID=UPI003BAA6BD9
MAGNTARPPDDAGEPDAWFGFRSVAIDEKQSLVDDVFDRVASRYDLMNDLMSGGLHRLWKDAMVSWLAPPRRARRPFAVLDVAGGTGDIAFRIAKRSESAAITVADINAEMLKVGRARAAERGLEDQVSFVDGNAERLPFADGSFDAVTIAFGIRNVPRVEQALTEARRVLKPGGRFLCLEFSNVDVAGLDRLYDFYSFNVIPTLGEVVTQDRESYAYLVESIRQFPNQARFAAMMTDAGFSRVDYRNLTGGVAALHSGWKL